MSDNRTTELREKLTERGVKWWPMRNNGYYEDRDTEFVANGKKHTAHEWGDGLAVYNLTPEQAVAATLGSGTLTADDVLNAVYNHGARWQAIADELNVKLGQIDNDECYLVYEGKKYPAELDFGFLDMMPITITVGGFRYLVEVPNGE